VIEAITTPQLKTCRKCGIEKSFLEFYPSYPSRCKKCQYAITSKYQLKNPKIAAYRKKYLKERPWVRTLLHVNWRFNNPNYQGYKWYGGKGIKNLLTLEQVKYLWFRDKANKLNHPSIDRVDSSSNYEISNCRFIELSENSKRKCLLN